MDPVPLVVHVPHSSTYIPAPVRQGLLLSDEDLGAELARMTFRYTDELFRSAIRLGGTLFVNELSRLVFDPERFPDPDQEAMEAVGMGAVYTRTSLRAPLRSDDPAEREALMSEYFRPYAEALSALVGETLARFDRCLIVDAHSYPCRPLPYERDPEAERPQVCIGVDQYHTPPDLVDVIREVCADAGLSVGINTPFAGSYVPLVYWRTDPRVSSVMVELRRDLYMDESTVARSVAFSLTEGLVERLLQAAVTTLGMGTRDRDAGS